jgi:hypothetical protein
MPIERKHGLPTRKRSAMPDMDQPEKISRRSFLKLGVLGISTAALAFAAGCGGEDDEDGEDEED